MVFSLKALETSGVKTEEADPAGDAEDRDERQGATSSTESTKLIFSFMRKTNLIRGLRSNLPQVVWRKKRQTFEEAVAAATEEEEIEMARKEEEVLSCFRGNYEGKSASRPLVNSIVAALEDGKRSKKPAK